MPPRRSCFPRRPGKSQWEVEYVSMPPRRSCFSQSLPESLQPFLSFNATTAFLLLGSHNDLSPPPAPFQCHHGVPASLKRLAIDDLFDAVSMPPRRSCFWLSIKSHLSRLPVSMPPRRSCFASALLGPGWPIQRFNATTAFLLPARPVRPYSAA